MMLYAGGTYEFGEERDIVRLTPPPVKKFRDAARSLLNAINNRLPCSLDRRQKPIFFGFKDD